MYENGYNTGEGRASEASKQDGSIKVQLRSTCIQSFMMVHSKLLNFYYEKFNA